MSTILRIVTMACLGAAASIASAATPAAHCGTATLKSDAVVAGPSITLGDIAEVRSGEGSAAIAQWRLAPAPRIGNVVTMTQEQIDRLVQGYPGSQGCLLTWNGARQVSVRRASQPVAADRLVAAARDQVRREWAMRFDRVEMEAAAEIAEVEVPVGQVALHRRVVDGSATASRVLVTMDIEVDGVFVRTVRVPLLVRASRVALVARHALPAGGRATADDIEMVSLTVSGMRAEPLRAPDVHLPVRLKRALEPGQALTAEDVSDAGAVLRGDRVQLVFGEGNVVVETAAVVQADARLGERVRVKPLNGDDAIEGRLVGEGVVQAEGRM